MSRLLREIVKATETLVDGLCAAFKAEDQAIEVEVDRRAPARG